MGQIRDSRFSSLNQIREQARENLETEQNIKLMEEKKLLMGRSNDKITEKTDKLRVDVTDIEGEWLGSGLLFYPAETVKDLFCCGIS